MELPIQGPMRTISACVCLLLALSGVAWQQEIVPPSFEVMPPHLVEFSNTTGTRLPCSASTRPSNVSWLGADGSPLKPVAGLREILPDGTLVLPPFRAEHFRQNVHATSYKCALTNAFGTIVSHDVTVKAVVLQPYDIYVYDVFTIRGSTAVMKCHIPKVMSTYVTVTSWIKDAAETISGFGLEQGSKFSVIPSGELFIKDVVASDGRSTFACMVMNRLTGETKKSITSGKLFITDPQGNVPPKITFSKKIILAKEGETALLPCEVQAHPMPDIRWSRSSATGTLEELAIKDKYSLVSGSLFITNVNSLNRGTYTCTASNVAGSEKAEVQLIISDPLVVSVDPAILIVDSGKPGNFNCKIEGSPATTIMWMKDGQSLSSLSEIEMLSNTSLRISSTSAEHKGVYQCFARNSVEEAFAVAVLSLGDSSPIVVSGFKSRILEPGTSINLQCAFSGSPKPRVEWFIDGQPLTSNIVQTDSANADDNTVSLITMNGLRTEDGGMYSCQASNRVGKQIHSARIDVYGNLGSRKLSKAIAVSGKSVILHCPFFGYPFDTIQWVKDERTLPSNFRQRLLENDNLMIQEVSKLSDSGIYSCTIKHEGRAVQSEVRLVVMVPPKLAPFSFQDELVREGMRGRLQCVVLEGDLPISLTWLKDAQPIPSSLGITVREIDEFSSILTIAAINPRHNGNYTCVAKNPAATVTFTTSLAVNVAPKIIPFSFQESGVMEGVLARVSCVVYQGDLPIKINWFKDGIPISSIPGIVVRTIDDYSSILTIESSTSQHNGNYSCIAKNSASSAAHSAHLKVNVPPKIVPFYFHDEQLVEGMLVRMSCVISRGDLPLTITWLKDGLPIPSELSISTRVFDEYSSVLSIDPVLNKHNGNYTCVARNHAASTAHTAELKIQVPPKWVIEPTDITAKSGDTVYLHCKAEGLPEPKITWMWAKDGKSQRSPIISNTDKLVMKNGSVIFKRISKVQEGIYFCLASNGVGTGLSKSVVLHILAPPVFQEKQNFAVGKKGENLTLTCAAFGDQPITFVWSMNNIVINPRKDVRYSITNKKVDSETMMQSNLTITWLDRKDTAMHICRAENEYGRDEMVFNVTVQQLPGAPVVEFAKEGNRSVTLSWGLSYDGNSQITNYIIQYKKDADNWQMRTLNMTVSGDATSATISGLLPATKYSFRVAAQNRIGNGAFSNIVTGISQEDAPTGAPLNVEVESTDQHKLRVTWKPPRKNQWNGAIRGYEIGFKVQGSIEHYAFRNLEVPEDYTEDLIFQLADLKMFTQYSIIVQAYNNKGKGPSSEPVVAMTSEDVPSSPPQGIRCSALSSKSMYVLWDPPTPESVNGIIRGFKILYKPVTEWYDSAIRTKTSLSTKITLQELEVNTNYTIQVLAFTKVGDGVKSSPVYCKTHEDVPESPQAIKVLPSSSDSVVVAWKSPKNSNGGITKYNVYYKPMEQGQEINPASDGGDAVALMTEQVSQDANSHISRSDNQFLEVKGLKKNKKYAFWVTASSVIGEGPSSDIMAQTVADSTVPAKSASFDGTIKTPWKRDVVLPCKAVGVPPPQRKWMIGDRPLEVAGRNILLSDGTLLINKVSSDDSGNYTCAIYNEHGKDNVRYSLVVQVPPAAPLLDVVSKRRSSIQVQWKAGPDGGEKVKGYILHFRQESGIWETKEISPDNYVYTLDGLACGSTYQMYLEAFNSIGTGPPCDVITVATEGSELFNPSKDSIIREGSTYVTIHLEAWPSTGCPIENFQVEYKPLQNQEWTLVSDSLRPSQKKLVLPGLSPATWYALRLTAQTNGKNTVAEYRFATLTPAGGTIPPPEIVIEHSPEPVYLFYLDPYIFIPSVALLIVVIIASVIICVCVKRKNGSMGSPDSDTTLNTWSRSMCPESFGNSQYPTLNHRGSKDRNPYATAQLPDCIRQHPCSDMFLGHSAHPQAWSGTLNRRPIHITQGAVGVPHGFQSDCTQPACNNSDLVNMQETTFVFPDSNQARFTPHKGKPRPDEDYDQPPVGI